MTSSHSVFVHEDGAIKLKRGADLRIGDRLVAPMHLRLPASAPARIDLLPLLHGDSKSAQQTWLRGAAVEDWHKRRIAKHHADVPALVEPRVEIPEPVRNELAARRRRAKITNRTLCESIGIQQPVTFYSWEKGVSRPTLSHFRAYLEAVGADANHYLDKVAIGDSRLERAWATQYADSGANEVRSRVRLADLTDDDLGFFAEREDFEFTPEHYADRGIPRFIAVNADLLTVLGFYTAEGSCSDRNGIRLSIGNGNRRFCAEMQQRLANIFGLEPILYTSPTRCDELKLVNRIATRVWQHCFGFESCDSLTKRIPDFVFSVSEDLRAAFLRGYLLGDGTVSSGRISMTTSSYDLASGLMYALSSLGIVASMSEHQPDGVVREIRGEPCQTRNRYWSITVIAAEDLRKLEGVWADHVGAAQLRDHLAATTRHKSRSFERLDGDLMALPITAIEEVAPSNGNVYDFSVEGDENFGGAAVGHALVDRRHRQPQPRGDLADDLRSDHEARHHTVLPGDQIGRPGRVRRDRRLRGDVPAGLRAEVLVEGYWRRCGRSRRGRGRGWRSRRHGIRRSLMRAEVPGAEVLRGVHIFRCHGGGSHALQRPWHATYPTPEERGHLALRLQAVGRPPGLRSQGGSSHLRSSTSRND